MQLLHRNRLKQSHRPEMVIHNQSYFPGQLVLPLASTMVPTVPPLQRFQKVPPLPQPRPLPLLPSPRRYRTMNLSLEVNLQPKAPNAVEIMPKPYCVTAAASIPPSIWHSTSSGPGMRPESQGPSRN
uniref:(northern house mosquito) hypothetical protein n=1 Tax=Culex pipiens TaxID=7175 RepID=A0A8D8MNJ9_CULPI